MGGLGNQLFQYAAGRSLALRHNTSLKLDISDYHENSFRKYYLDHFLINAENATISDVFRMYKPEWLHQVIRRYSNDRVSNKALNLMKKIGLYRLGVRYNQPTADDPLLIGRVASQRYLHYDPDFENLPDDIFLFGFWVSQRYFSKYAKQISQEFRIHRPLSRENFILCRRIQDSQSVSIHIRRTDKVTNPNFYPTSLNYTELAIARMEETISNPVYYFFSDDIGWVKDNFPHKSNFIFVDHNDDLSSYEDLRLMSLCKHNIIAESSFSWWAAWLNSNSNKIVISPNPNRWIVHPSMNSSDIIQNDWIIIE